jgi:transcriptional regulator with XRE-family HTH domain
MTTPDPDDYRIPTIEELDAMRVAANLSMKDLSECAGFTGDRFSHILHNDINPQTRTIRAFLTTLQEFDGHSTSGDQGPAPEPSDAVDEDGLGPTEVDVEQISARLNRLNSWVVGWPEADR